MNTIQQKNRKERPLVLGTGGGTGNLLPVAEGQEGITKTAHDLLLLRNPGNQLPGLPTFTKNIFEKAISPMPAMLNAVQLEHQNCWLPAGFRPDDRPSTL
jgi:hypothetical protein